MIYLNLSVGYLENSGLGTSMDLVSLGNEAQIFKFVWFLILLLSSEIDLGRTKMTVKLSFV